MKPLRLINPRIPRHMVTETLDQILADTRPGVRRFQRRSTWRTRIRWAQQHSRWVTVPSLLMAFFFGFWLRFGLTGLVAAMLAVACAIAITGLLYASERHIDGPRGPAGPGGWIA